MDPELKYPWNQDCSANEFCLKKHQINCFCSVLFDDTKTKYICRNLCFCRNTQFFIGEVFGIGPRNFTLELKNRQTNGRSEALSKNVYKLSRFFRSFVIYQFLLNFSPKFVGKLKFECFESKILTKRWPGSVKQWNKIHHQIKAIIISAFVALHLPGKLMGCLYTNLKIKGH